MDQQEDRKVPESTTRRPTEKAARAAVEAWLDTHAPGYPTYSLCEDGDDTSAEGKCGWAFWIVDADTTSYVHEDLSIEWYGTMWPERYRYDGDSGNWIEVDANDVAGSAAEATAFRSPSLGEIVGVLREHPLIRLREKVTRAFLIGSFATGTANEDSDVDILLEVKPRSGQTAADLEEHYRQALRQYFMKHDIRGRQDSVHPNWCGRRVDVYFTYAADAEERPKQQLVGTE